MAQKISSTRAILAFISLAFRFTTPPGWSADSAPAARLLIPADGAVAESRKLIRDAYANDYMAAKDSGEPAALLDKLRTEADADPEPAKKYAFLLEAEDVSEQFEDHAATLAIVDRRADLFDIDCLTVRSKTLARLAGPKIAADVTLLEQAIATATNAAAAERFDIATELATLALKIAQAIDREQKSAARRLQRRPAANEVVPAANGVGLIKSMVDLQKQLGKQKELFTKYEEAKAVLAVQPEDPAANAAAGTYLCFVAQKWDQGLPHLKRSQLPVFSTLARDELTIDGSDPGPKKVFAIAGRWWDASEDESVAHDDRIAVQKHASRLYVNVRPKLTDPLEIRVADTRSIQDAGPAIDVVASPLVVNSIGMKLKLIPAGTFQMGSDEGEPDEKPVHEVQITKPFYLGVYEVTNAQWKAVMGSVPSQWRADGQPVQQVNWNDAMAFCRNLSERPEERMAKRVYRLPTEAEWEYACRAGTTTQYSFGDDARLLRDFAWGGMNSGRDDLAADQLWWENEDPPNPNKPRYNARYNGFAASNRCQTHPVGQKKPNPWGLHDMHGNVWEWCSDGYGPYGAERTRDPRGSVEASKRVIRGGGWFFPTFFHRSAIRLSNPPTLQSTSIGFRVALSPPTPHSPQAGK